MTSAATDTAAGVQVDPTSRWGLGDVVLGLALFAGATVAMIMAILVDQRDEPETTVSLDGWTLATVSLINVVVFIGVPVLTSRRKGTGSLAHDFGLSIRPRDITIGLAGGFVAIVFGAAVAGLLLTGVPDEASTATKYAAVDGFGEVLLLHLVVGGLVPASEELFFRGMLLRSLLRRNGPWLSLAASAALFGLLHVAGSGELGAVEIARLGSTVVFGLVFGALTLTTEGRLGAPILAHVAVNQAALLVALT